MNYYELSKIKSLGIALLEYQEKEIELAKTHCKEFSKFYPAKVMFRYSVQDGKTYFEHVYILLEHAGLIIQVKYDKHRKKWLIHSPDSYYKNLSRWDVTKVHEQFTKPNQIGVLTTKKIQDWVSYYESIHTELIRLDAQKYDKVSEFLKSLEGLEVKWSNNQKTGSIVKNGIEFTFSIDEGNISKKLELRYSVPSSIESFKKLSDNKYVSAK